MWRYPPQAGLTDAFFGHFVQLLAKTPHLHTYLCRSRMDPNVLYLPEIWWNCSMRLSNCSKLPFSNLLAKRQKVVLITFNSGNWVWKKNFGFKDPMYVLNSFHCFSIINLISIFFFHWGQQNIWFPLVKIIYKASVGWFVVGPLCGWLVCHDFLWKGNSFC